MGFHRLRVVLVLFVLAATLAGCIVAPLPWWRHGHGHGQGHGHGHGHHGHGGRHHHRY